LVTAESHAVRELFHGDANMIRQRIIPSSSDHRQAEFDRAPIQL